MPQLCRQVNHYGQFYHSPADIHLISGKRTAIHNCISCSATSGMNFNNAAAISGVQLVAMSNPAMTGAEIIRYGVRRPKRERFLSLHVLISGLRMKLAI